MHWITKKHFHFRKQVLAVVLILASLFSPAAAAAQAPAPLAPDFEPADVELNGYGEALVITETSLHGCAQNNTVFSTLEYLTIGQRYVRETIVSAGPNVYMAQRQPFDAIVSGEGALLLYQDQDIPGLNYKSFPLPSGSPLTVQVTLYREDVHTPIYRTTLEKFYCLSGNFNVLESRPISPALPMLEIISRTGIGQPDECDIGEAQIALNLYLNLDQFQSYRLQQTVTEPGGNVISNRNRNIQRSTGLMIRVLDVPLPTDQNYNYLIVSLTLRDLSGMPYHKAAIHLRCDSSFSQIQPSTAFPRIYLPLSLKPGLP